MTSNLASRSILDSARLSQQEGADFDLLDKNLIQQIDQSLGQHFRPEFLNRIDEVIRFRPLKLNDLHKIICLYLADLSALLNEQGLDLRVDEQVVHQLATQGYEPEYGARPLRRVLRRQLENPLATELLEERFKGAHAIRVKIDLEDSGKLRFLEED